jgi:hypothetical protein
MSTVPQSFLEQLVDVECWNACLSTARTSSLVWSRDRLDAVTDLTVGEWSLIVQAQTGMWMVPRDEVAGRRPAGLTLKKLETRRRSHA